MIPGGLDETGSSTSTATNSGVVISVAVEVGGLQPFQVNRDLHSISLHWKSFRVIRAGKRDNKHPETWPFPSHSQS